MKKVTITLALVAALLTGCKSNKVALEQLRADVSWSAFCAACGSVDEEAALIEAGVEPY